MISGGIALKIQNAAAQLFQVLIYIHRNILVIRYNRQGTVSMSNYRLKEQNELRPLFLEFT